MIKYGWVNFEANSSENSYENRTKTHLKISWLTKNKKYGIIFIGTKERGS